LPESGTPEDRAITLYEKAYFADMLHLLSIEMTGHKGRGEATCKDLAQDQEFMRLIDRYGGKFHGP
jgi:hypothetical protein